MFPGGTRLNFPPSLYLILPLLACNQISVLKHTNEHDRSHIREFNKFRRPFPWEYKLPISYGVITPGQVRLGTWVYRVRRILRLDGSMNGPLLDGEISQFERVSRELGAAGCASSSEFHRNTHTWKKKKTVVEIEGRANSGPLSTRTEHITRAWKQETRQNHKKTNPKASLFPQILCNHQYEKYLLTSVTVACREKPSPGPSPLKYRWSSPQPNTSRFSFYGLALATWWEIDNVIIQTARGKLLSFCSAIERFQRKMAASHDFYNSMNILNLTWNIDDWNAWVQSPSSNLQCSVIEERPDQTLWIGEILRISVEKKWFSFNEWNDT